MEQLSVEFKNVPRDASQVPCSTNLELNSLCGVMDSAQGIVLADNNLEENLLVLGVPG